jgi:hypothetical protein
MVSFVAIDWLLTTLLMTPQRPQARTRMRTSDLIGLDGFGFDPPIQSSQMKLQLDILDIQKLIQLKNFLFRRLISKSEYHRRLSRTRSEYQVRDHKDHMRSSLLSIVLSIVFWLCRPELPVVETVRIHGLFTSCLVLRSLRNSFHLSLNPFMWARHPIHSLSTVFSRAIRS